MTIKKNKRYEILSNITAEVSKVVIGKDEIKELLLIALLSQGHVLIEGLTGTAKTTIARTFASVIGGTFKRVQGTPDMLPADILGFCLYQPDGSSRFMPGPIFGSPGTSPLSEVQLDRFMFRVWSGFPNKEEEDQILQDIDIISEPNISPVATRDDILQLQQEVKKVYIADSVRHYIIDILEHLRHHQDVLVGPSPRGGIALFRGARALAFNQKRDFVIPDDVKRLFIPALSHRLQISAEAEMEDVTPEAIINEIATEVPVPKIEP